MPASDNKRVINANILLYGPTGSGKSSNLRFIQRKLKPGQRGEIETRHQEGDPSVTYEYLPIQLGPLMGYETNLFIYTVPAGESALETRLNLLPDAAGVAFIAHSGESELDRNIESLDALKEELRYFGLDYDSFPLLFQYNHRNAPDALATEVLNRHLNPEARPTFDAVANGGEGVRATFAAISKLAVRRVRLELIQSQGESTSSKVTAHQAEASASSEEPPVLAPPPVRIGVTSDANARVEASVGDDVRAVDAGHSKDDSGSNSSGDAVGSNSNRVSAETSGVRIENLRPSPRLSDYDLETSGEFRRVSRDEIFTPNLADFGGEPMMVEAIEATDEHDDDEYEDGDLSMPPTMLTEEEQAMLAQADVAKSGGGSLVLPEIPSMAQFEVSAPQLPGSNLQLHVVAEDDSDDEEINLLGVGDSLNLDDTHFNFDDDDGDELDLDELGLEDEAADDLLDDDALELSSELDLESDEEEAAPEEVTEAEPELAAAPVDMPFETEAEVSEAVDDAVAEEQAALDMAGEADDLDDEDEEGGPHTIAITALPELNTADAFQAPIVPEVAEAGAQASIVGWGDVERLDGENIVLPVTVRLPDSEATVELAVTLNVQQLVNRDPS